MRKCVFVVLFCAAAVTGAFAQTVYKDFTFGMSVQQVKRLAPDTAEWRGYGGSWIRPSDLLLLYLYNDELASFYDGRPPEGRETGPEIVFSGQWSEYYSKKEGLRFYFIDNKLFWVWVSVNGDVLSDLKKQYGDRKTISVYDGWANYFETVTWMDGGRVVVYDRCTWKGGEETGVSYFDAAFMNPLIQKAMQGYGDNSGTIYYSYNGTGHVYLSENVFYLCSNGKPAGYREDGVIYAFDGRVLGFYENAFIYNKTGDAVGAADPKSLGADAAARRNVTRAAKQTLPAKQAKIPVSRPLLKNHYIGGSLQDIF